MPEGLWKVSKKTVKVAVREDKQVYIMYYTLKQSCHIYKNMPSIWGVGSESLMQVGTASIFKPGSLGKPRNTTSGQ